MTSGLLTPQFPPKKGKIAGDLPDFHGNVHGNQTCFARKSFIEMIYHFNAHPPQFHSKPSLITGRDHFQSKSPLENTAFEEQRFRLVLTLMACSGFYIVCNWGMPQKLFD